MQLSKRRRRQGRQSFARSLARVAVLDLDGFVKLAKRAGRSRKELTRVVEVAAVARAQWHKNERGRDTAQAQTKKGGSRG